MNLHSANIYLPRPWNRLWNKERQQEEEERLAMQELEAVQEMEELEKEAENDDDGDQSSDDENEDNSNEKKDEENEEASGESADTAGGEDVVGTTMDVENNQNDDDDEEEEEDAHVSEELDANIEDVEPLAEGGGEMEDDADMAEQKPSDDIPAEELAAVATSTSSDMWACLNCTYAENEKRKRTCKMCGEKKPKTEARSNGW